MKSRTLIVCLAFLAATLSVVDGDKACTPAQKKTCNKCAPDSGGHFRVRTCVISSLGDKKVCGCKTQVCNNVSNCKWRACADPEGTEVECGPPGASNKHCICRPKQCRAAKAVCNDATCWDCKCCGDKCDYHISPIKSVCQ